MNAANTAGEICDKADAVSEFDLTDFFPYQTRLFYKHVSDALARVYVKEYNLKSYEWRSLAILGTGDSFTPAQVVALSSLDKVSVSRAVANLEKRGWIVSRSNEKDRRSRVLKTTIEGRRALAQLLPKMQAVERDLLARLEPGEQAELRRLMAKIVNQ